MYRRETLFTYCHSPFVETFMEYFVCLYMNNSRYLTFLTASSSKSPYAKNPSVNLWAPMFMQECGRHCFLIPARFLRQSLHFSIVSRWYFLDGSVIHRFFGASSRKTTKTIKKTNCNCNIIFCTSKIMLMNSSLIVIDTSDTTFSQDLRAIMEKKMYIFAVAQNLRQI
jgi:hypothetical protein